MTGTRMLQTAAAAAAALLIAVVSAAGGTRSTTLIRLSAILTSRDEVPGQQSTARGGSGRFVATLKVVGKGATLYWHLTLKGLSSEAIAAQIQIGARGVNGPRGIDLCGPCTLGETGQNDTARSSSVVAAILKGGAYVNIHTKKNPKGEIRGQIRVISRKIV